MRYHFVGVNQDGEEVFASVHQDELNDFLKKDSDDFIEVYPYGVLVVDEDDVQFVLKSEINWIGVS